MQRWMIAAAMASALLAFKSELQGAYHFQDKTTRSYRQDQGRHQASQDDVIILRDGSQLKGKIASLPKLKYSFGTVAISPGDLASLAVNHAEGEHVRLTTKQGLIYAANMPQMHLVMLVRDPENGKKLKKKVDLADVSLVISKQEAETSKSSPHEFYTLELKSGEMFPICMEAETIVLSDGFQEFEINSDQIVNLHVNGGIHGVIQDKDSGRSFALELLFTKEKYLSFVTADYFQSIKMPWDIISKIEKVPHKSLPMVFKSQQELLREELSYRTPVYSENDSEFYSAGITTASIKSLVAITPRLGLSQSNYVSKNTQTNRWDQRSGVVDDEGDEKELDNGRDEDRDDRGSEDNKGEADEEFSHYFSFRKHSQSQSDRDALSQLKGRSQGKTIAYQPQPKRSSRFDVIPKPSLGKAGIGVINEDPGEDFEYSGTGSHGLQDDYEESAPQYDFAVSRKGSSKKDAQVALAEHVHQRSGPEPRLGNSAHLSSRTHGIKEKEVSGAQERSYVPSRFLRDHDLEREEATQVTYLVEETSPDFLEFDKNEKLTAAPQDMIYISDELLPAPSKRWKALEVFLLPNSTLLPARKQPVMFVKVPAFYIDAHPVTNLQYQRFAHEMNHPAPLHWSNGLIPKGTEQDPVTNIAYRDAEAYAKWAGKRLPSEIELSRAYQASPQFRDKHSRISEWTASTIAVEAQNSGERYWNKIHPNQGRLSNFRVVKVLQNQQNLPVEENKQHALISFRCLKDI